MMWQRFFLMYSVNGRFKMKFPYPKGNYYEKNILLNNHSYSIMALYGHFYDISNSEFRFVCL